MTRPYILIIFSLLIIATVSCKKDKNRSVNQRLRTSNLEKPAERMLLGGSDLEYTEFGKLITKITPDSFFGILFHIKYFDEVLNSGSTIALLGPEVNTPSDGILVDFKRDTTFSLIPKLTGNVYTNADGTGSFYKETDVTFNLLFIQMGFKLNIKLPAAYDTILLTQFKNHIDYGKQFGSILRTNQFPLNQVVPSLKLFNVQDMYFYFGRTDTTFIEYSSGPQPNFGPQSIHVRSARYTPWILKEPMPGETHTVTSSIGFNFENIIHLYSGADNIAYTADDIIVFEPKFWERIFADVKINNE